MGISRQRVLQYFDEVEFGWQWLWNTINSQWRSLSVNLFFYQNLEEQDIQSYDYSTKKCVHW